MKNIFLSAVLSLCFFVGISPTAVAADCNSKGLTAQQIVECGACAGDTSSKNCQTVPEKDLNQKIETIVNYLTAVIAIIAVIMIIVGGFRYITSAGDTNRIAGAKNTILWAIIGIIIVALAQLIVRFVINTSSSTDNANKPNSSQQNNNPPPGGGEVVD